jgi:hypothetical protein
MDRLEDIHRKVHSAILQDNSEIHRRFISHFSFDIGKFSYDMAKAFKEWKSFDDKTEGDRKKAAISGILYLAITLNISSMKLFIAGNRIASGNIHRQVLESIALAFLFSDRSLDTLELFMKQKYPANRAIKDVIRHQSKLHLTKDSLNILSNSYRFYQHYNQITSNTIASFVSIADKAIHLTPHFEEDKISEYKNEIDMRVSLASIFENILKSVIDNVSNWKS